MKILLDFSYLLTEFCTEHSAKLTTKERKAKEEELYKQR